MKRILLMLGCAAVLFMGPAFGADKPTIPLQKLYGKLMSVDFDGNDMSIFNKSKKLGSNFKLDSELKVVLKNKFVPKTDLEVGQNVIVYYTTNLDTKVAKRITIRSKRTKKQAKTN